MFRFKNEKGLTLIELLITISVLAVVSAIALPVINNVVTSSNSNALTQTIKDAEDFIAKYSKSGVVLYDGLRTLSGYVDADGDNVIDAEEKIDTLTLNEKYVISATGSASVGGQYSNGGVIAATVSGSGSAAAPSASPSPSSSPVSYATQFLTSSATFDYSTPKAPGTDGWWSDMHFLYWDRTNNTYAFVNDYQANLWNANYLEYQTSSTPTMNTYVIGGHTIEVTNWVDGVESSPTQIGTQAPLSTHPTKWH